MKTIVTTSRQAVIYCRVSGHRQIQGYSLTTQKQICSDFALKNGYEIVNEFIEEGESAKTADRTQLLKLLEYCSKKRNNIRAVIYYKLDRFARYQQDYFALRHQLKKYGIVMLSATEHMSDDPAGRFMEGLLAAQAQFDNEVRTERSVNGMKEAIRNGRYVWGAPFGYSNSVTGGKGNIAPNAQAAIVKEMFKMVAENVTPIDEVRKRMYHRGLMNRKGKPFAKGYYYRLLKNKLYMGVIEKLGITQRGTFEPIVSEELFAQVQLVLKHRGRQMKRYSLDHHDFPLRRFIKHPDGYSLRGSWSRGKSGKHYAYYRFEQAKGINLSKDEMERRFISFFANYSLDDKQAKKLVTLIKQQYLEQTKDIRKQHEKAEKRLSELNERTNALVEKNLAGIVPDEILKQQLTLIEKEKMEIYSLKANGENKIINPDKALGVLSKFYQKPHEFWAKADYEGKIQLQMFAFPLGIIFDGAKMRTPETCEILKASLEFRVSNDTDVRHSFISENKIILEAKYLTKLIQISDTEELFFLAILFPPGLLV